MVLLFSVQLGLDPAVDAQESDIGIGGEQWQWSWTVGQQPREGEDRITEENLRIRRGRRGCLRRKQN